jgi:signal transduction histidine kinase
VNLESDKLPAFSKEFQKFLIKENIDYIYTEPVTASSGKLLGSLGIFIKAGTDPASKAESVKRILHILGVVLERGNAFSNIETQQKVYTDLVNTIDGIVYEYDLANKKYDFVSNRAPELLGYPLDLWYNELDFQMNHAHPEDKELLDDIMNSFFPETSMECEYRMIAANGDTIWCRDYIRIIYKKDQPVKLKGIIFDNTRAKNSEVEKELAASDLIKRNRDLEQFTYIVSHNLRAPLANIMGCTNAMDFIHDEEERKELIQGIADSAQRLDAVVRDLNSILSIQMVASETIEKIELVELVQDVISSLKPEWRGDFEVQVNLAETPYLNSVKPYVYSIFHNLISNAYKYRSQKKSPLLIITTTARDKMVEMSFKDNGQGIDLVANKQNIFGMYKRFHTDVEGKGMGLFMVKAQVEALQGSIQVASEVNKGTEFIIALPQ